MRTKTAVLVLVLALMVPTVVLAMDRTGDGKAWWQHPGLGIAYSTEYNPDWAWNRNFKQYNGSLMDSRGNLRFPGPYCKVEQFVQLSRDAGADYHLLYAKWHDGICFFDTRQTKWKTPEDYMASFSRLSKAAGIPFSIYYSSIFDHNPQFDWIQPFPYATMSFIQHPIYINYMKNQYRELVEQYKPDGIWLDWYSDNFLQDATVRATIDFFSKNYPDVAMVFNASGKSPSAPDKMHYTTEEIHSLGDPEPVVGGIVKSDFLSVFAAPIFYMAFGGTNGWETVNKSRRDFDHYWSAISPVGVFWQDPTLRTDPSHLPRIVAAVMASGGHITIQANMKMDGYVFEEHVSQIGVVGEWYKPRKHLFNTAVALRYDGDMAPGIDGLPEGFGVIASQLEDSVLLHIIKREGSAVPSSVAISEGVWGSIKSVYLEPGHDPLEIKRIGDTVMISLEEGMTDPVDTILRLEF